MNCEERRDLITQLVCDGLEPREREELRAHIDGGCLRCAEALAEARDLRLALSLSPDRVEPSPRVKERLREWLRESEGEPRQARSTLPSRRRVPVRIAFGLAAVAAGLVVAALFQLRSAPVVAERDALREELFTARARQAELEDQVLELRSELEMTDEEIMESEAHARVLEADATNYQRQIAMLRSKNVIVVSLRGTARQSRAVARVFWGEDYYCYLRAENLRALPEGRSYALWLETEGRDLILAGTFGPGADGAATLWVPLDSDPGEISRVFVTEEPEDDVGQDPTGAVELESRSSA